VVEAQVEQLGQLLRLGPQPGQIVDARRRHLRIRGGRALWAYRRGAGRAAGRREVAVLPPDHRVHGDQRGVPVLDVHDGQQRAGPRVADPVRQAAPGRLDQRPVGRVRHHVLRQQRHVVAGADHLAEQRQPQHLRRHHGDDLGRPGQRHPARLAERDRRDRDLPAVAHPQVAQRQVVGVQQGPAGAGLGPRGDPGGGPVPGQPERITRVDRQRGHHLGVQPDDAAACVESRRPQGHGQREIVCHRGSLR
jgi:hypothetical protein